MKFIKSPSIRGKGCSSHQESILVREETGRSAHNDFRDGRCVVHGNLTSLTLKEMVTFFPRWSPIQTLGRLSTRAFKTPTATGREHFARKESGVSQIFIVIIPNGVKVMSNANVVV